MDFYDNELESVNFKQFITGIVGVKADGSTIRSGHPYAIKEVIIESANLGLEDIVLYDVPGFNSPTELHEKQTLEMLREADAIILVTNVGVTPNLDKSQLGILRSGRDEENIPLSDKAFVFGNQIDRATNLEVAKRNAAELKSDALDNAIAKENHIFFGAAKAYLESLGIESSDVALKGSTTSLNKMEEWKMLCCIDELWTSMTDYYNNDRFDVLVRRAENTIANAKDGEDRYTDFFAKIFLHDNSSASETMKTSLENFFRENKETICAGLSFAVDFLPFGSWAKLLLYAGLKANELPGDLKSKLQGIFYRGDWINLSKEERIKKLGDAIAAYANEKSDFSGRLTAEKLRKMHEISRHMEITNEDEMLRVLNEDIEILRKFTLEAIVYAIGLEQEFISVMTKNVNIIRRDKDIVKGQKIFDEWILQNIRKIREDEFRVVDQRNLENQMRQNIVKTVRKYVDSLAEFSRPSVRLRK